MHPLILDRRFFAAFFRQMLPHLGKTPPGAADAEHRSAVLSRRRLVRLEDFSRVGSGTQSRGENLIQVK
jgi:hypothetical protein